MKCPTMEICREGKKVTINVTNFNSKTMIKWGDPIGTEGAEDGTRKEPSSAPIFKFKPKG